jgi:aspartyl-tRNA(Asn)/glutamyl-tRNA(Gln) amidotransferase subunit B
MKIGIEIHGYLLTNEKLFCNCKRESGEPNKNICPICTGQPGSKPMLPNKEAIKKVVEIALMLNSNVNTLEKGKKLVWQRKHYNWPDMPKGYQNTLSGNYAIPVAEKGEFNKIRLTEMHLEEDPAAWNPETGQIDYNRSGFPLIEIVTEPDFKSSEQLIEWLKELITTLSYIKSIDKKLGIKADVNVNIEGVSTRTEIKNLHSISDIVKVIEYEEKRHQKEKPQKKETRRWNPTKKITEPMREKESEQDYCFISDPDLPAIIIKEMEVEEIKKTIPETPRKKLEKMVKIHNIDEKNAKILSKNLELVEFAEEISKKINLKKNISWLTTELLRVLNYNKKELDEVNINPEHFIELIIAVEKGEITELKAKQTLNEFIPNSFSIKGKKDLNKISEDEINSFCKEVIKNNPKAVEDYKQGKPEALNYLMGEVMKLSKKRADYRKTIELLKGILK